MANSKTITVQAAWQVFKQITILLLSVLFTSCNGQNKLQDKNDHLTAPTTNTILPGDTTSPSVENIRSMWHDKNDNYWFGSDGEGVYHYAGKALTLFTDKDGLCHNQVRTIQEDKAGNIWFGNNGYGLFRYDGTSLINLTEEKGLSNPDFFANFQEKAGTLARVWTINEDTNGDLWIGTIDAGVWRYDGKNLTNYTTKDGLAADGVTAIYKDKKGELWFGTAGDMCKFNGKSFVRFAIK